MATVAQIRANRRNSEKSTGPRTDEGKAVVAKNAVKHGLFAQEAVITGENREDYDALHDAILEELAPAGVMERILAERVVSLTWRMQRAERMQNQAIEVMIARDGPSALARQLKASLPPHLQESFEDQRGLEPELILGRVTMKNMAGSRSLERLMMYERRIENSLHKTIKELDRRKLMQQLEIANADDEPEEVDIPARQGTNLKKQSQLPAVGGNCEPIHSTPRGRIPQTESELMADILEAFK